MDNTRKPNGVKKILDGVTSELKLKDYIMFDDNWISENDKVLYNKKGESFSVIDFIEIETEVPFSPPIPAFLPVKKTYRKKFSCVKLDKGVNIGDIFYTELK